MDGLPEASCYYARVRGLHRLIVWPVFEHSRIVVLGFHSGLSRPVYDNGVLYELVCYYPRQTDLTFQEVSAVTKVHRMLQCSPCRSVRVTIMQRPAKVEEDHS